MTPSEDRRFYRAGAAVLLGSVFVAVLSVVLDLAFGWIYLCIALMLGAMVVYVHHQRPDEEEERRELFREQGWTYPPPARKRRLRR